MIDLTWLCIAVGSCVYVFWYVSCYFYTSSSILFCTCPSSSPFRYHCLFFLFMFSCVEILFTLWPSWCSTPTLPRVAEWWKIFSFLKHLLSLSRQCWVCDGCLLGRLRRVWGTHLCSWYGRLTCNPQNWGPRVNLEPKLIKRCVKVPQEEDPIQAEEESAMFAGNDAS